jgi:hypothetical protein
MQALSNIMPLSRERESALDQREAHLNLKEEYLQKRSLEL